MPKCDKEMIMIEKNKIVRYEHNIMGISNVQCWKIEYALQSSHWKSWECLDMASLNPIRIIKKIILS